MLQMVNHNKLSMHPGKTELIRFGSKSKLRKIKDFTVTCEGQVTKAKPLSNTLD